jgi:hypothetical protein
MVEQSVSADRQDVVRNGEVDNDPLGCLIALAISTKSRKLPLATIDMKHEG